MKRCIILILGATCLSSPLAGNCDTHYVSQHGSDEPPYVTPETASRTIEGAVHAAGPGDTVAIADGDYHEHVVMCDGLRLLGSGRETTRIWGSVRAAVDAEISQLAILQQCGKQDPGFAPVALLGPSTGGLIVTECLVRGTFEEGISCTMVGGFVLITDCQLRVAGVDSPGFAISLWGRGLPRRVTAVVDKCVIEGSGLGLEAAVDAGLLVSRCSFTDNATAMSLWSPATVMACSIDRNENGVMAYTYELVRIESSTLCDNGEWGLWCPDEALVQLVCCTISRNGSGGIVAGNSAKVIARRCVIWGNASPQIRLAGLGATLDAWDTDIAGYCDDPAYCEAAGIIDADPLFINPDDGDYRLRRESPCIDRWRMGSDSDLRDAFDRDGKPRLAYGGGVDGPAAVDMGAYEYHINELQLGPGPNQSTLTWSSIGDQTYSIFYTEDLLTWHVAVEDFPSAGNQTTSWIDDGIFTGVPPSLAPRRFYRVLESP